MFGKYFAILLTFFLMTGAYTMEELKLIPMPQEMKFTGGKISLSNGWEICVDKKDADDVYAAKLLQEEAEQSLGLRLKLADKKIVEKCIILRKYEPKGDEPELFKEQGYLLKIADIQIIIEANTAQGRYYGVQTLRQIMRLSKNKKIPNLEIKDYPALKWRGISDDISRGQVSTLENFKRIIRELAFYKKNLYQPYMEDMFAFEYDQKIGRDRGAVTHSEMAQLVEEAKKNHVLLSPVFECLGHQDRLLSLPGNRKYAEIQEPDKTPWSFSPVLPEAFEYITNLIDELAKATPSPFFHIGGDESFDIGKGTSKELVEKIGVGRVHAEYFTKLRNHITENLNRKMLLYGDMLLNHTEDLEYMPKDCIFVDWHYSPQDDYPSVKKLKDMGFEVMVSPGIWSWACFYPNHSLAFRNVGVMAQVGKREKALGCITSSWGDDGNENIRENNFLAYSYSAAAEWEKDIPDTDEFLKRHVAIFYGLDSDKLAEALKLTGWHDYLEDFYPARFFHNSFRLKQVAKKRIDQMNLLEKNASKAAKIFKEAAADARFNKEHFDILDNVTKRYLYLAKREKTVAEMSNLLLGKKSSDLSQETKNKIVNDLKSLRSDLVDITNQYQVLWLKTNKFPKLDFNTQRLQRQIGDISNAIDKVMMGEMTLPKDPNPVFFWYPDADPTKNTEEGSRYFLRTVNITEKPVAVDVKCWADDRATVFVNGRNSLTVNYGDAPIERTVTHLIKEGENTFAVETFNAIGAACVIVQIKIIYSDRKIEYILGDDKWLCSKAVPEKDWQKKQIDTSSWTKIKILGSGTVKPWDFIEW